MFILVLARTGKQQVTEVVFEFKIRVQLADGLHARPASQIVDFMALRSIGGEVYLDSARRANLESVLEVMLLGAKHDDVLAFRLEQPLSEEDLNQLAMLVGVSHSD